MYSEFFVLSEEGEAGLNMLQWILNNGNENFGNDDSLF